MRNFRRKFIGLPSLFFTRETLFSLRRDCGMCFFFLLLLLWTFEACAPVSIWCKEVNQVIEGCVVLPSIGLAGYRFMEIAKIFFFNFATEEMGENLLLLRAREKGLGWRMKTVVLLNLFFIIRIWNSSRTYMRFSQLFGVASVLQRGFLRD